MTVLPMTTTEDSTTSRMFEHPDALRGDGPDLIFCGHYDGHDVYRRLDVDLWVLVYGNATEAVFEVFGSKAWRWLAEVKDPGCDTRHWGSMRAIIKARRSTTSRIDKLVERLVDVVQNLPDEGHNGWCRRAVDVCSEAADWIEELRKGVGI
jgi:hypothetical protein